MKNPNQIADNENAGHSSGIPIDPFAVDFFGGERAISEEPEDFSEKLPEHRRRIKQLKKSDWHKNLPQISNAEAEFSNLLTNLPENLTPSAAGAIAAAVARYALGANHTADCSLRAVSEVNLSEAIRRQEASPKVFLRIEGEVENSPAIVSLNVEFAAALIESMLDGSGEALTNKSALSPIETTIIEFLGAVVLNELNLFLGAPMLRLGKTKSENAEIYKPHERGAHAVFNLNLGDLTGGIDIFAPAAFLAALDRSSPQMLVKKSDQKRLSDFEKIAPNLDLRVQIGATFLDSESLLYLEPDDIVLIENPQLDLNQGILSANLPVFVGRGTNFQLRGIAEDNGSGGGWNFIVEEMTSEETRRRFTAAKFKMDEMENDLTGESGYEPGAEAAENHDTEIVEEQISPVLENIQVGLRVEIAGNKISLRELQSLRAGQIIALGCSPTDPVRLVTDHNEEPVATGELIDIEGQLGVRLTKVFI